MLVAALGAPLTSLALLFGPAEYFSLMVLGLCFAVVLARGSILKALAMVMLGLLLVDGRLRHRDRRSRAWRSTFPSSSDGIGFVVVAMGVFGFAEIMRNLEQAPSARRLKAKLTGLMPTWPDLKAAAGADRARHRARLGPRHSAGRRRGDRRVRGLYV